jgi:hypothetical protein
MKLKRWKDAHWKDEAEKLVPKLEHWQKAIISIETLEISLKDLFGWDEKSYVNECIESARTSFMKGIALCIGDESEWLDWYSTQNRYGKKKHVVAISKEDIAKPVKTLFDLAVILTAPKTEL